MRKGLSKSKLLSFRQCSKKLYLEKNNPELIEITPDQEKIFNTGHAVGELAQRQYPEGVLIKHDFELSKALEETQRYMDDPEVKVIFEATFNYKNVLIRADILHKTASGVLIQEVKSSTSVKDVNIDDCAIQTWVIEGSGYHVDDIALMHINNQFVYQKKGDYTGYFNCVSLLDKVRELRSAVPHWVTDAFATLELKSEPNIIPGEQCKKPYDCPFINYCDPITTEFPVGNLPNGTRTAIALRQEGIEDIRDIPDGRLSSENHERIRRITISGQYELDAAATLEMEKYSYPRYYIDFETIMFAIPRWLGTRPYQQTPFQWSCHVETSINQVEHVECLDTSGDDPSRAFAESLINAVGNDGPIFVYNAGFENSRMKELANRFPDLSNQLLAIIERVVDLLPMARKYYYHPDMQGSWSIKRVLPTIAPELNYDLLEGVHDGGEAQNAYIEAIDPETSEKRSNVIRDQLIKYCEQDTLAMIKIAHFFQGD